MAFCLTFCQSTAAAAMMAEEGSRQSHWPLKMAPTYRYVSMPLTSFDVIRDLLDRKVDSSHTSDFLTSKIIITETILT